MNAPVKTAAAAVSDALPWRVRISTCSAKRLLVACVALVGGCGGDGAAQGGGRGCTAIGCGPQVRVELPDLGVDYYELVTVRACVAGRCGVTRQRAGEAREDAAHVELRLPRAGSSVRVTVRVTASDGQLLARAEGVAPVRRSRPNGPRCPPECRSVALRLDEDRRTLRELA